MAIIKWRPGGELDPMDWISDFRSGLDQLFERSLGPWRMVKAGLLDGDWVPGVDVLEDEDKVVVKVDVPGISKEEISLSVQGEVLTVQGEKKQEEEYSEADCHRVERVYGRFQRTISLPAPVDADKVSASCRDGVLEVTLPKKEEVKPRKIEISGGEK